jgi:multidrug efflux pump subunit AcrA (membrane-fusion protein)
LEPREVVLLPSGALTSLAGTPAVWVVDPKTSEVSLKPVTVASYETHRVVIDSGLDPGERVITAGAKMLRPKQIVTLAAGESS